MNRTIVQAVDPADPTPLYLQIAEHIRDRIRRGELADGDALAPLREAAEAWGVNLHTVRHAYAALAREGMVETSRGPRGTRVLAPTVDRSELARDVIRRAMREYDLNADDLLGAIQGVRAGASGARPVVWVIECSLEQCESHAREIMERFDVEARPLPLHEIDELPQDHLIATYFHYNDIRRAWPHKLRDVHFVSIAPDADVVTRMPTDAKRVRIIESDIETARAIASDVTVLFGPDVSVEPVAYEDSNAALETEDDAAVLFPPRAWQGLTTEGRKDRRAIPLRYVIEHKDLQDVASRLHWRAAANR
jgi:DNA-binding transcriptional regulator YhcF (GntR family)